MTAGLMAGASRVLSNGGALFLYGPYLKVEVETAPSNRDFDADLRQRDSRWGLRQRDAVTNLANRQGLVFEERVANSANNLLLVYRQKRDAYWMDDLL